MFRILNSRYWNGSLKEVPVFKRSLSGQKLGQFVFTPEGFNSISLASNQDLTIAQALGVLLHEMCHVSVLERYGPNVAAHGKEWQAEMRKVGFSGCISELTDGLGFFNHRMVKDIIKEYETVCNKR